MGGSYTKTGASLVISPQWLTVSGNCKITESYDSKNDIEISFFGDKLLYKSSANCFGGCCFECCCGCCFEGKVLFGNVNTLDMTNNEETLLKHSMCSIKAIDGVEIKFDITRNDFAKIQVLYSQWKIRDSAKGIERHAMLIHSNQ
eukprot:538663_1